MKDDKRQRRADAAERMKRKWNAKITDTRQLFGALAGIDGSPTYAERSDFDAVIDILTDDEAPEGDAVAILRRVANKESSPPACALVRYTGISDGMSASINETHEALNIIADMVERDYIRRDNVDHAEPPEGDAVAILRKVASDKSDVSSDDLLRYAVGADMVPDALNTLADMVERDFVRRDAIEGVMDNDRKLVAERDYWRQQVQLCMDTAYPPSHSPERRYAPEVMAYPDREGCTTPATLVSAVIDGLREERSEQYMGIVKEAEQLMAERDRLKGANEVMADAFKGMQAERDELSKSLCKCMEEYTSLEAERDEWRAKAKRQSNLEWAFGNDGWFQAMVMFVASQYVQRDEVGFEFGTLDDLRDWLMAEHVEDSGPICAPQDAETDANPPEGEDGPQGPRERAQTVFADGCRDPEVTGGWPDEPEEVARGLTVSDDGQLLNWRRENYVSQAERDRLLAEVARLHDKLERRAKDAVVWVGEPYSRGYGWRDIVALIEERDRLVGELAKRDKGIARLKRQRDDARDGLAEARASLDSERKVAGDAQDLAGRRFDMLEDMERRLRNSERDCEHYRRMYGRALDLADEIRGLES